MLVCLACYGPRVAALLESATELRFYGATGQGPHRRVEPRGAVALPAAEGGAGLAGLIGLLEASGAQALLCGGLTRCALQTLLASGVPVVPWVGGSADEVARAWWSGRIQTLKMPGCAGCRHKRRHGADRGREVKDMNRTTIAITSEGPKLTDMVDPRFGRAAGFVVVDLATGETRYVDNGGSQALAQGAGIQAAENVARAGAGTVLSGFVGPKAFQALSACGIAVIQNVEGLTVGQAVEKYRRGELEPAQAPNAPSGGKKAGGNKGGGRP